MCLEDVPIFGNNIPNPILDIPGRRCVDASNLDCPPPPSPKLPVISDGLGLKRNGFTLQFKRDSLSVFIMPLVKNSEIQSFNVCILKGQYHTQKIVSLD